jgi:hypothetical protein
VGVDFFNHEGCEDGNKAQHHEIPRHGNVAGWWWGGEAAEEEEVAAELEAEVELDEERSEHGWVDTNALRRVGVEPQRVGVELDGRHIIWGHDQAVITDITVQRERRICTRELRKAAGIGGQLLGDCQRPSLPNKFGTNPQAESGKRLVTV